MSSRSASSSSAESWGNRKKSKDVQKAFQTFRLDTYPYISWSLKTGNDLRQQNTCWRESIGFPNPDPSDWHLVNTFIFWRLMMKERLWKRFRSWKTSLRQDNFHFKFYFFNFDSVLDTLQGLMAFCGSSSVPKKEKRLTWEEDIWSIFQTL